VLADLLPPSSDESPLQNSAAAKQKDMSILLIWLLCAIAAAMIGNSKKTALDGFALGLCWGPSEFYSHG
jgi:hypothetical protein